MLIFSHRANNPLYTYYLNSLPVPVSNSLRDLGVDLDPMLRFNNHINAISSKAQSRVGIIFRSFVTKDIRLLKLAYTTFVRPLLEYNSAIRSLHLHKHIFVIENVQRYFTRRIYSLRDLSYSTLLAILDLEPLDLRRLRMDLSLCYKIINNLTCLNPDEYFTKTSPSGLSTHSSHTHTLYKPFVRSSVYSNHFVIRHIDTWNALPTSVINAPSLNSFKNLLKQHDLSPHLIADYT